MTLLKSKVLKTEDVDWRSFQYIQQEGFKDLPEESMTRLKASIVANNFTQPFYVWQDESGNIWCLDGRHRTLALEQLKTEGYDIPYLLPATFIDCADKKEAARLVVIYSSIYAKITQQGLFDFIEQHDLSFADLKMQIDLPDFSEDRFEQKFDLFDTSNAEEPEPVVSDEQLVVKPGDIFRLNEHRIACGSFKDKKMLSELMHGEKGRIVTCDPPYNLPTIFFEKELRHKDFAEAHGEMSDEAFMQFLMEVMMTAVESTVDGAIHFIFMDWRHSWHMTEAARRVYGSAIPKQLCVWNKDIMANGSFYRSQHELSFVFQDSRGKAQWNNDLLDRGGFYKDNDELCFIFKSGGDDVKHLSHLDLKDRIRTNVWNYPSAISLANPDRFELKNHPTPKPVQMIADSILDTTNEGDIVIDFFSGSGTALMASEHTRRKARVTEIEPIYVQSAIIRYCNYCQKHGIEVNFSHFNGNLTLTDIYHGEQQFING